MKNARVQQLVMIVAVMVVVYFLFLSLIHI